VKPGPQAKARGGTLKRAPHERGSALLIVFVFAAMVAILLYQEMPVAAFEAKRQKEQLLIDRGNEYAHAVKLFVRKTGTYPASLDALENTNNMRFLRHRFVDPFTGKDDWRLLHAGPGGMLIDSKVNPLNANSNPNSNANRSSGKNGSQTNSSFSNSSFSNTGTGFSNTSTSSASNAEPTLVKSVPQRPPAIPANGAPSAQSANADQDPTASLLTLGQAEELTDSSPAAVGGQAATQTNGQPRAAAGQTGTAPSESDMMRNLASNPNPQTPRGNTAASRSGRTIGGGIAGVASNAKGESIKSINDQTDYSLWEFYYDPSKDLAPGMNGTMQTGTRQNGQSSTTQSGFGSSSFSQSSPSQNSSNLTTDTTNNVPAMAAPRPMTSSSPQQ
jgi:hypothetical protein